MHPSVLSYANSKGFVVGHFSFKLDKLWRGSLAYYTTVHTLPEKASKDPAAAAAAAATAAAALAAAAL